MKSLKFFSSETAWPVFNRFRMGPSIKLGMLTICSDGSAPFNKIDVMPIYGKTLKILISSTKKALRLNIGIQHRGLKVYQVCQNDKTRMTNDLFIVWSNLSPSCCGNIGKLLHGICKYAITVSIR